MHKVGARARRCTLANQVRHQVAVPPPIAVSGIGGTSSAEPTTNSGGPSPGSAFPGSGNSTAAPSPAVPVAGRPLSDMFAFPCLILGEFGQAAATETHFVAEWANCGPMAYLAATMPDPGVPGTSAAAKMASPGLGASTPAATTMFAKSNSPGRVAPRTGGEAPGAPAATEVLPTAAVVVPAMQVSPALGPATPGHVLTIPKLGPPSTNIGAGVHSMDQSQDLPVPHHDRSSSSLPPSPGATPAKLVSAAGPVLPVALPHVKVGERVTCIHRLTAQLQQVCKDVLVRATLQETADNFHVSRIVVKVDGEDVALAVGAISFQIGDQFARGGTRDSGRRCHMAVAFRDFDALCAAWPRIRLQMLRLARKLQAGAELVAARDAKRHSHDAVTHFKSHYSQQLRTLRALLQPVMDYDAELEAAASALLVRLPMGDTLRRKLVRRAQLLRPNHVGFIAGVAFGNSALMPTLVVQEATAAPQQGSVPPRPLAGGRHASDSPGAANRRPLGFSTPTGHSIAPIPATAHTAPQQRPSRGGLFPDTPLLPIQPLSFGPSALENALTEKREAPAELAGWLHATYITNPSTYMRNVCWPLTAILMNDGDAGTVAVAPRNGATLDDVVAFQRAAEGVFGRVAWHNPPPLLYIGAATRILASQASLQPPTPMETTPAFVMYVDGGNDGSSPSTRSPVVRPAPTPLGAMPAVAPQQQHQQMTLAWDSADVLRSIPPSAYSQVMAARCAFESPHRVTETEAALRSDVHAARVAASMYVTAQLVHAAFLRATAGQFPAPKRAPVAAAPAGAIASKSKDTGVFAKLRAVFNKPQQTQQQRAAEQEARRAEQLAKQRDVEHHTSALSELQRASVNDVVRALQRLRQAGNWSREAPAPAFTAAAAATGSSAALPGSRKEGIRLPLLAIVPAAEGPAFEKLLPDAASLKACGVPWKLKARGGITGGAPENAATATGGAVVDEDVNSAAATVVEHFVLLCLARHLHRP